MKMLHSDFVDGSILDDEVVAFRLVAGWDEERARTTPVGKWRHRTGAINRSFICRDVGVSPRNVSRLIAELGYSLLDALTEERRREFARQALA